MKDHLGANRRPVTRTKVILALVALVLVVPAISFTQAMTYPGNALARAATERGHRGYVA